MWYNEMLRIAGFNVIDFMSAGSYQGEWIAQIGDEGFISGSYGSCSGCDSLEALEDSHYAENNEWHYDYLEQPDCKVCINIKNQVIEYGKSFTIRSAEETLLDLAHWGMYDDREEISKWIIERSNFKLELVSGSLDRPWDCEWKVIQK